MIIRGRVVLQLALGLQSRRSAQEALDRRLLARAPCGPLVAQPAQSGLPAEPAQSVLSAETEQSALLSQIGPGRYAVPLIRRLQAYAAGELVDFRDVAVDLGPQSDFRRRIVRCCRQIPYGRTATYGQLARLAGSPGAARAVGQVMAANRVPIIVPCHRVVAAGGALGGFSAPGGVELKRRLLEMEAAALNNLRPR